MQAQPLVTPWYRQFWPWFIIALPASAVVAGLVTLSIAINHPDAMVVDDYYKEGLAINRQMEKEQAARDLGLQALLRFDTSSESLTIEAIGDTPLKGELNLQLVHPTLAGQDRTLTLAPDSDGRYIANLGEIASGRWHIVLEPADGGWRLSGRASLTGNTQLLLAP